MADTPQPDLHDIAERVKAKEKAREIGIGQLQKLQKLLHDDPFGRSLERLRDWDENMDALENNIKSREILRWKELQSTHYLKSCETVEAELYALKVELADLEDTRKAQGENPDPEYNDRCAQATRQVKNVASWSGLTQDLVRKSSPEEIIRRSSAFSDIFRSGRGDRTEKTFKPVKAVCRKRFLELLRPYVSSSTATLSGAQYWPLVEQVEVFLQSRILRHGIKLVDLPGVMDALESRAQIARDYFERLEKRIVVTPATRAADNRAAAELILSERDTMVLDMNDMLKPDSLCVAITKIDDIDCESAENEFSTDDIRRICRELKEREEREGDDSGEDDDHDRHDDAYQAGEKRQRGNDAPTRRVRPRTEIAESEYGNSYSHMDTGALKSRLKALCIQERNAELKKVNDDLLATRKKNRKSRMTAGTLTEVFPVSSKAFRSFKRSGERCEFGEFLDRESTGIPSLRSWLHQVSLDYREEWVDGDIHHMQVLFDAADGWNQGDDLLTLKLTGDEETKVKNSINRLCADLKEHINNRVRGAVQRDLAALKPLRNTPLTRANVARKAAKEGPELATAVELLDRAVKGWERKNPRANFLAASRNEKTHWSTYRACVRRYGGPFNRPARNGQPKSTIHWMDDVRTHIFEKYIVDVRERVARFQQTSRDRRGDVHKAMVSRMRPGFEAAIQHKGSGFMRKQMEAVHAHASTIGYSMFETVRNDLETVLASDIKKLSTEISGYWSNDKKGCGTLIKEEMVRLFNRLCGKKGKFTESGRISVETKNRISDAISAWRLEWHRVFIRLPKPTHPLDVFEEVESAMKIKMEGTDAERNPRSLLRKVKTETFE
ncbi:hypothetical protein LX36DRAFT_749141 [Colletotrichum falcatum]|nr:hypothetical protein LX36DRAFT_749141 [Colletotrichum falcatum]